MISTMDILAGGALTGGAMNPARAFGLALLSGLWADHWVCWPGRILGSVLAARIYNDLLMQRT